MNYYHSSFVKRYLWIHLCSNFAMGNISSVLCNFACKSYCVIIYNPLLQIYSIVQYNKSVSRLMTPRCLSVSGFVLMLLCDTCCWSFTTIEQIYTQLVSSSSYSSSTVITKLLMWIDTGHRRLSLHMFTI